MFHARQRKSFSENGNDLKATSVITVSNYVRHMVSDWIYKPFSFPMSYMFLFSWSIRLSAYNVMLKSASHDIVYGYLESLCITIKA